MSAWDKKPKIGYQSCLDTGSFGPVSRSDYEHGEKYRRMKRAAVGPQGALTDWIEHRDSIGKATDLLIIFSLFTTVLLTAAVLLK